ncbi:hypothetical protein DFH06DRAFT_1166005 [Mycena polygramma]|nr:hypothetical protein DFH06DRAFT_1166005 [Mycena polygramma]
MLRARRMRYWSMVRSVLLLMRAWLLHAMNARLAAVTWTCTTSSKVEPRRRRRRIKTHAPRSGTTTKARSA